MSDCVKKLLMIALSFGTTAVLIGLSIWWVPTLYDGKPTTSFTWASEPEDTGGSTSGGSYAGGNGTSDNNGNTTESPGPVGSGDNGNQGGTTGKGGSGSGEAGGNGGQDGNNSNGGSANGSASGSANKPGSSSGNVTSSKPGKPATSSGGGNGGSGSSGGGSSGTPGGGNSTQPGGEDGGPLTPEEKSWFHNDLTDEQNAVAPDYAKQPIRRGEANKTPLKTVESVFASIRASGDKPQDNSPKYCEAYHYACGRINEVTQIKMLGLVLDILGIKWEYVNEHRDTHKWIYFYYDDVKRYADFKSGELKKGNNPLESIFGS